MFTPSKQAQDEVHVTIQDSKKHLEKKNLDVAQIYEEYPIMVDYKMMVHFCQTTDVAEEKRERAQIMVRNISIMAERLDVAMDLEGTEE